jgi:hypothetical protein
LETLIINGPVTLIVDATLSLGTLALNNDLNMGNNVLTLGVSVVTSGMGDVIGQVSRSGFAANTTYSFGNPYVAVTFGSTSTVPSNVIVNLAKSAPGTFTQAIQRTYAITPTGGTYSATLQLHYTDSELNGSTESALDLWRMDPTLGSWDRYPKTAGDTSANWAQRSGITAFSQWTLSSVAGLPTAVTLAQFNAMEVQPDDAWLIYGMVLPPATLLVAWMTLRRRAKRQA